MQRMFVLGALCALLMYAAAVQAAEPTTADQIAALKSPDAAAKVAAINQLGAKGAKAAEAVPALTQLLADPSAVVRGQAAHALGQIGEAAKVAAPELVKLVGDADPAVRRNVGDALRRIRPGPQVTVPLFAKLMSDSDPGVRLRAMNVLADAGEEAMPFLLAALKDEKAAYWACLVLRDIGPKAKGAVPALAELAGGPRPEVRREAILALAAIGEAAAPATPQLAKALDDPLDRTAATFALGAIGASAPEIQAKIRKNINDSDQVLRVASVWALAKLHKGDKRYAEWATKALVPFLKQPDPAYRTAAARALADIKPGPDIAAPIFEEAFQGADEKVLAAALDTIAQFGAQAVPGLIKALSYEKLRPRVAYVLGQLGPAAAPASDALVGLLDDKNPETQKEAVLALAKIGPAAKAAVPALTKVVVEREGAAVYGAAYALGKIGPDAASAKPALLKLLQGKDESAALIGAHALAQIDPKSEESAAKAVPVLIRGLSDEEAKYRVGAAEALKVFGPLAKSAVPALEKAAKDEDKDVQQAADEALKAIGG
jgi:HEAT repeat protein